MQSNKVITDPVKKMKSALIFVALFAAFAASTDAQTNVVDIRELLRAARVPQSAERRTIPQALAEIFAEVFVPPNVDPVQAETNVKNFMKALFNRDFGAVNTQLQEMARAMAASNRPWSAAKNASAILSSTLLGTGASFPSTLTDKENRFIDLARDLVSSGSADAFKNKAATTIAPVTSAITNTLNTMTNTANQLTNSISGAISSITLKPPSLFNWG